MRKLLALFLLYGLAACQSESRSGQTSQRIELLTPNGDAIQTTLAISPAEQERGLSGKRADEFGADEGMLFFYPDEDERHFWMPDTYFDLDLFYMDKDLRITDIIRRLPHYVGRANPDLIPRARGVWARHVLELKSTSAVAQRLKTGDVLKWKGTHSLRETEERLRRSQTAN